MNSYLIFAQDFPKLGAAGILAMPNEKDTLKTGHDASQDEQASSSEDWFKGEDPSKTLYISESHIRRLIYEARDTTQEQFIAQIQALGEQGPYFYNQLLAQAELIAETRFGAQD